MKRVFRVKIVYKDGGRGEEHVIANDDVAARAIAIKLDAQGWRDNGEKPPAVDYCEISFLTQVN